MRFRNLAASARPSSQNVSDENEAEAAANTSLTDIVIGLRGSAGQSDHDNDDDEWIVNEDAVLSGATPAGSAQQNPNLTARSLLKRKSG